VSEADPRNAVRPAEVDPSQLATSYTPNLDGRADPGEVVWAWVPYEENDGRGKDRPLLVMARLDELLYGLMLSSNSDRDGEPDWLALGPGAWDGEHRTSWIRLDRLLELPEDGLRREGAVLEPGRFAQVCQVLRDEYGWQR
jgi:hypothetical protein